MSPSFMAAMAVCAFGPMQSSAKATGRLRRRATSAATGRNEYLGSRPFGRSKCESRMILPPLSASSEIVGTISSMRVESVTLPSCIGTLRSTRMSTRLPLTSASSRLRKVAMKRACEKRPRPQSAELTHSHRSVDHAIGETPFIVVPRHDADQRAVDHLGLVHVKDRRMRIVVEVAGDVWRLGVAQDARELLLGGAFDRAVDLILAGRALSDKLEIDH